MRVIAFDIGEVRCGIAISDPAARVASPVCVLPTREVLAHAAPFRRVIEDWEPEIMVSGLPKTMSGEDGPQAARIREAAASIQDYLDIPLYFEDERLSSKEAKRILREQGFDEKSMRGKIDMIAASLFLQTWLDEHRLDEQ